jgi:opacity protein-like surface antigen
MRRLYQCAVIAALLLGVAPFTAEAQTMALPNGLYLGVDVGAIVPQSISVHSTSSGVSFNGDLDFDTGVATGITLGYHVTPVVAVEGNFEYAGFDLHSLSGTVSVSGGGSSSGSVSLQGRFNTYNGLFNAIWTPLAPAGRYGISPYIGAGIGFSHITESLSGVGGVSFSSNSDETDFAANGIVGADFPIPFVPQLTAGLRYRLLFVNTGSSNSGISNGDFIGHVFTANATWHF